jgi:2-polyprenyl-6-methoxyphenol hydroxylase-like FAD-dependent oxidoreductase
MRRVRLLIFVLPSISNGLTAKGGVGEKPVQRVAIIGSGIAGLAAAHALTSLSDPSMLSPIDVCMFDARPGLDSQAGAGIQLNGALAVLGKINTGLQRAVIEAGQPVERVRSRAKPWEVAETASATPFEPLLEIPLRETIENAGGEAEKCLISNNELLWTSIMRSTLQETLYNCLPGSTKSRVAFNKLLIGIEPTKNGSGGAECIFADGSRDGPFDLIIGADGIKSAVKENIGTGRISKDPSKREGAAAGIYTGVRIRYAVQDGRRVASNAPPELGVITQYFGDAAYCFCSQFGTGNGRPNARCAFITYLDSDWFGPFRKGNDQRDSAVNVQENADWSQDNLQSRETTREKMLRQLTRSGAPDFELRGIIESADRFFELGVYAHNPFSSWSREIPGSSGSWSVLVGDAAHALPPFLGQGGNQAIQDACCLGAKVHEYNRQLLRSQPSRENVKLRDFLKEYERTRWLPTFEIFLKSLFLGYLETGGFDGAYSKFRDVFFKAMGTIGVARQVLLSAAIPKV